MKTKFLRNWFRINCRRLIKDDSVNDRRDECCIGPIYNKCGSAKAQACDTLGGTDTRQYRQHITLRPNFRKGTPYDQVRRKTAMKKPAPFNFRLRLDIGLSIPAKQLKKLAKVILIVTVYQLLDQHPVVVPEHPRIVTARPAPDTMRRLPGQLDEAPVRGIDPAPEIARHGYAPAGETV